MYEDLVAMKAPSPAPYIKQFGDVHVGVWTLTVSSFKPYLHPV
jgi:hypothetical protein